MNFCFLHLEYGAQHRDRSLELLRMLRHHLANKVDTVSLVVVDNARAAAAEPLRDSEFGTGLLLPGDNANREFSGWDKGVSAVLSQGAEPDIWIFTNDTVAWNHAWSEQRIARFAGEIRHLGQHPGPWLFGEINAFPGSTQTPLGPLLEWVATYCFAMNGNMRQQLEKLSPDNALLDSLVRERFEPGGGLYSDEVDPGYADFISAWLVKDDGDPARQRRHKWSHEWHKATPLSPDNFDDLRMKARCCLSESMLSVRARQLGAEIRSPYDARNAREHIRRSAQFVSDKVWEKFLMRRLRQQHT
ncbi:MAG: hypothetical protein WKG52_07300 [Variovorax sp.]